MNDDICPILCEKYGKNNPCIDCPYCNKQACCKCVKKYILGLIGETNCMHCGALWSDEIMEQLLPTSFLKKEYRYHRLNLLCESEKSYFEETIRIGDVYTEFKKIETELKPHKAFIRRQLITAFHNYHEWDFTSSPSPALLSDDLAKFSVRTKRYNELKAEINELRGNIGNLEIDKSAYKRHIGCPEDNCEGIIYKGHCSICKTKVCTKCEVKIEEDDEITHICDENDVLSVKAKLSNCKPCPKCKTYVEKSYGCDQMFCTNCKTPFCWKTLQIITHKRIHNPHYSEYLEQKRLKEAENNTNTASNATTEEVGNIPENMCQGYVFPWAHIGEITLTRNYSDLTRRQREFIENVFRRAIEYYDAVVNNPAEYNPMSHDVMMLRYGRLKGIITYKNWQKRISALETKRRKLLDLNLKRQCYIEVIRDVFLKWITNNIKTSEDFLDELTKCNDKFKI